MNYIFIDTNIYLNFYITHRLEIFLDFLIKNKKNVIVTKQVVDEILRNKVAKTLEVQNNSIKNRSWKKPILPYQMDDDKLTKDIKDIDKKVSSLFESIEKEFLSHIKKVSNSEDKVSIKLEKLFDSVLEPKQAEIIKAESIKKFGNPPGKKSDPIGDEISWVQIVNYLQKKDSLIIVTNDSDFASTFKKESILNSALAKELKTKNVEFYIFSKITEGIEQFKTLQERDKKAINTDSLPNKKEIKEIEEEEKNIGIGKFKNECPHKSIYVMQNGIFDDYYCTDCNRVVYREYSDQI